MEGTLLLPQIHRDETEAIRIRSKVTTSRLDSCTYVAVWIMYFLDCSNLIAVLCLYMVHIAN